MMVNYDANAFMYFVITMLVMYLVPAVLFIVRHILNFNTKQPTGSAARSKAEAEKLRRLEEASGAKAKVLFSPIFTGFVVFTVAMAVLLVFLIATLGEQEGLAQYDPYAILSLHVGASEAEVRRAYKKLALKFHPDRPGGDAETFAKLAKAHDALTDPEARKNYELYGNPDGRQALEVSLGLPAFMTHPAFLCIYLLFLVVAVPALMCWCDRANKDKGIGGLLTMSFEWLKYRITSDTHVKLLPEIYGGCGEFGANLVSDATDEQEIQSVGRAMMEDGRMQKLSKIEKAIIPPPLIFRNSVLLHAHVHRYKLVSPNLHKMLLTMLKKLEGVVQVSVEICVGRTTAPPQMKIPSHLTAAYYVIEFGQLVTQALWVRDSSLRQVFSEEFIKKMPLAAKRGQRVTTMLQYLRLPEADRPGLKELPEDERAEVSRVLHDLPNLDVKIEFGVLDEEYIAERDIVTATVTLTHLNLSPDETVPPVYAPHFPYQRKEEWFLFLEDSKGQLVQFAKVASTKSVHTVKLMFQAPQRAGKYSYRLHVRSNAYMGLDQTIDAQIDVKPASEVPAYEEHEEDAALSKGPEQFLESVMGNNEDESDISDDELPVSKKKQEAAKAGETNGTKAHDGTSEDHSRPKSEGSGKKDMRRKKAAERKTSGSDEEEDFVPSIVMGRDGKPVKHRKEHKVKEQQASHPASSATDKEPVAHAAGPGDQDAPDSLD